MFLYLREYKYSCLEGLEVLKMYYMKFDVL
jgi:hypothetical protein